MTWTNFLLILSVVYLIYYSVNLIFDLFLTRRQTGSESNQDILFFNEDTSPELITYEDETEDLSEAPLEDTPESTVPKSSSFPSGVLQFTGGVSIKELFNLAKDDLIEYTKTIPY